MFDGIIAQLKPVAHHCQSEFSRLMQRLESIQTTIADTSQDPLDRRSFARYAANGNVADFPLFTVPPGQVWIAELVCVNQPTGNVTAHAVLHLAPGQQLPSWAGQLDSAGSAGQSGQTWTPNAIFMPGQPVFLTITNNATFDVAVTVQLRQVDIPTRPEPSGLIIGSAHTGSSRERLTQADGPPQHELGRDAQAFPTPSR